MVKIVPSVTTVLARFKESDALVGWAYNTGYAHGAAGKPKDRFAESEEASGIGTYTHALVEWHLNGRPGPEPDPTTMIAPAHLTFANIERGRNGYKQFLNWKSQTQLALKSLEKPLVSEEWQFGGTPDGYCKRDGRYGGADWKTSRRLYSDYLLQLAGYWILWDELHPKYPWTDGVHIIRFSKDYGDFTHAHFAQLDAEKEMFLHLLEAYKLDRDIRGRV